MTRYFYTDPLAAAWMAKHFGIRFGFYDERSDFREYAVPITGEDDCWRSDRGRFFVHLDSLHLLEPKPGDVIHNGCCSNYYVVCEDSDSPSVSNEVELDHAREWFSGEHHARIIQRKGMPFHWPESERA